MGHDHHFLSRLDRVDLPHVELALALYRDDQLIRVILEDARIPPAAPRVAIALADGPDPPCLVVARDGHFVTCLGAGMSTGDLAVLTRAQLDGVAARVQDLRTRVEMCRRLTGGQGECNKLLDRIYRAGDGLTREEFIGLSAWQPLLRVEFLKMMLHLAGPLKNARREIRDIKYPRAGDRPMLHAYHDLAWAMAHLVVLVGMDARDLAEDLSRETEKVLGVFSWPVARQGLMGFALRGAWAVGHVGKPLLGPYKQNWAGASTVMRAIDTGLGLAAIGLAHARLRAEVGKALSRSFEARGTSARDVAMAKYLPDLGGMLARLLRDTDKFQEIGTELGRHYLFGVLGGAPPRRAPPFRDAAEVPEDLAIAMLSHAVIDIVGDAEDADAIYLALPAVVRAKAEWLYFPREIHRLLYEPWTPEQTFRLLAPMERLERPRQPERVPGRPGRNDPCSCGSGKKFKKCCGG